MRTAISTALHLVVAAAFVAMAAVQLNDPDPAYWFGVYLGGAAVAAGKAGGRFSRFWTTLLMGAVVAGLVIALPGTTQYLGSGDYASILAEMRPDNFVEPAREFFGLLLLFVALAVYLRPA